MSSPMKPWRDSDGLEYFCRHLVALCTTAEPKNAGGSDKTRFFAGCGTLINIRGHVMFLTAGHIVREVEKAFASDQYDIKAVLADTFGAGRKSDYPIPFDLKNALFWYMDDDELGLDFGVIFLRSYYVNLLALNGIVALEERNWAHQDNAEFDGYAMLGLPAEFTSEFVSDEGEGVVSPVMFRVQKLPDAPSDRTPTIFPQFVGQLDQALPIKSVVVGMSGGPIFGFCLEPQVAYWVVALQSSWNAATRTVYACPLPLIARLLTRWSEEIEADFAA